MLFTTIYFPGIILPRLFLPNTLPVALALLTWYITSYTLVLRCTQDMPHERSPCPRVLRLRGHWNAFWAYAMYADEVVYNAFCYDIAFASMMTNQASSVN